MKRTISVSLHIIVALTVFGMVRWVSTYHTYSSVSSHQHGKEDYAEECQGEGCDSEEVSELYETYSEECSGETCSREEVAEIAGNDGAINAMLNDFQSRGLAVKPCSFSPPLIPTGLNNGVTGDNAFVGGWCNDSMIGTLWNDFHFDKPDWDQGWGWEAACNVNLPLGRTFNALALLRLFGTSMPAGSNNWLPWFYPFASNAIDELDGRCGNGQTSGTLATTWHGCCSDNRTELYWGFFYGQDVPSRAGTIVHEARHADGGPSHNGSTCAFGSCDTNWGLFGSRTYEVLYVWWLRFAGDGSITVPVSNLAQTQANAVLAGGFDNRPTRGEVWGSSVSNPSAFLSVP